MQGERATPPLLPPPSPVILSPHPPHANSPRLSALVALEKGQMQRQMKGKTVTATNAGGKRGLFLRADESHLAQLQAAISCHVVLSSDSCQHCSTTPLGMGGQRALQAADLAKIIPLWSCLWAVCGSLRSHMVISWWWEHAGELGGCKLLRA